MLAANQARQESLHISVWLICKLLAALEEDIELSHHMQVVTNAQNVTEGMRTALAVRIGITPMRLLQCAGITGLNLYSEEALVISLVELKVFMQLEGTRTPGSKIAVAAATVRGSQSFGMICSAQDLGWMEASNGLAVKLPQGMELGTVLGSEVPEVHGKPIESSSPLPPSLCMQRHPLLQQQPAPDRSSSNAGSRLGS